MKVAHNTQWLFYGMLACLLYEKYQQSHLPNLMADEAEAAGNIFVFEDGGDEMYAWLAHQEKRKWIRTTRP